MRLFKNDRFGIKHRAFRRKVKRALYDSICLWCKSVKLSFRIVYQIGIPENDAERQMLKTAVARYDEAIAELESHMKYARSYIKED